ncbi:MAG TPA: tetratricopeptide repeat protein [Thermoanaerobaculia bacterium]|nr:tetratricopeptide repeat protein [Thermoanaerobaculia bacterium]
MSSLPGPAAMYCQACGAANTDEQEYCRRCHQKLLVLSGNTEAREEALADLEDDFSFDEHLLERISVLEEALRRTTETVEHLLGVVHRQQEGLALSESALATLQELLDRKGVLEREEWEELWDRERDLRLLALDKRSRFLRQRERILALQGAPRRDEFLRHLGEAERALDSLDLERAVQALDAAFRLDRENYELALFLGETLFNAGDHNRAQPYFQRVLEIKPRHFQALVYAGVILHESGDDEGAKALLEQAIRHHGESFLAHFSLGAIHFSDGELERAVHHLERAVRLDASPQALYLLGRSFHRMGRLTAGIRCLEEAVRKSPLFEEAFYQLGLACLDRRWHRKALSALRQAQRLNPRKLRYRELVRSLSGEATPGLPQVPPAAAQAVLRGEEAMERSRPNEARRCFRQALAVAPDHPTLLTYYALACLALDRTDEVEAAVREVAAREPGEVVLATAYAIWIEALRGEGRYQEGNRLGRQLLARVRSDFSRSLACYELARNLAELEEDLDEALDLARRSVDLAPDELKQFPLAALGWVHFKRKEYRQAVEFLARSSQLGPSAANLEQLGQALRAAGQEEQARQVLDEARGATRVGPRGGLELELMECLRDSSRASALSLSLGARKG